MSHGTQIARNTLLITGALIGQKILSFFYFAMIARYLGVEDTGRYFLAVSFTLMFSVLADLGFAPLIVREAAKQRERVAGQLRTMVSAKMILTLITFIVINAVAFTLPYPSITKQLIFLGSINVLIESWHAFLYAILRGWQRLEYESVGIVVGQFMSVAIGVLILLTSRSVHLLIVALLIGNTLNAMWAIRCVRRLELPFHPSWSGTDLRSLALLLVPFAFAAVFTRVTGFIDTFLLSLLGDEVMVGLYSVPFKVAFALQFIPLAFAAALLPGMSGMASDRERLSATYVRGTLYLLYIALPIAIGISLLSDEIIRIVFGLEYMASIPTLRVLSLSIIFLFINFPIGSLLVATDKQKVHTTLLGVSMAVNIGLNLILIPRIGILAPAIAAVVGQGVLFLSGFSFALRSTVRTFGSIAIGASKGGVAVACMAVAVVFLKTEMPLLPVIAIGGVVYSVALFATRALTIDDIRQATGSLRTRV